MADNRGVPEVSVVIPTYRRPLKLAACLRGLAGQELSPDRYEVLVGLDGEDAESAAAARSAWGSCRATLRVEPCPRQGYNATRNRLLALARGRVMLSLNDDVRPDPRLIELHAAEHARAERDGRPVIVSGYSPWRRRPDETLLDRLVRETSIVFFYDRMTGAEPHRDWGFRHCWGLNFSAPLGAVREVGGFVAFPLQYGYDDIELAWRLQRRFNSPVLFRPGALAEHDHRYGARELLDRERRLGRSAWEFAGVNPAFGRDVFGRDIRSEEEISYSREFVSRERTAAERLERSFLSLESIPASAVDGPHREGMLNLVYEQHLLLKRWCWRQGLLDGADPERVAMVTGRSGAPCSTA
jgi:glycosyltransferase involved in cell wall biosynthesis